MVNEEKNLMEKSIDEIIAMVNSGDVNAINELGYRYFYGEGVEKNKEKAFQLYNDASKKGSIKAKFNLAMCYYNGDGTERNATLSFDILKEFAEKHNDYRSYYYLGEIYFWGDLGKIDYEKAYFYYNESLKINPDYLKAKFCIAYAYYSGKGIEKNYETAFNIFSELVEKYEYKDAYFYLGEFYYFGKNIQKDYKKAILYFNKSIEYGKNIYASKYYLGEMYLLGKGVNSDCLKAKMYFEEILDEKHNDAYYKLALIHTGKYGLDKDENKVKEYFNKIEADLCIALIYYVIALKPEEERNLDEIFRILGSEMEILKQSLLNFPENHPSKLYHDRLSYLNKDDYKDIVEKLKNKINICRGQEMFENILMSVSSDDDVIELAKCIVEYTEQEVKVEDLSKKYINLSLQNENIKKLTIINGNYLAEELIELTVFNDRLKCAYKQSHNLISDNHKEENKYCEMLREDMQYIFTLIGKIDIDENVSDDEYLEGGSAGKLGIEYEDGTILSKEFGSYMPKDINELYQAIINKLNSVDSINE